MKLREILNKLLGDFTDRCNRVRVVAVIEKGYDEDYEVSASYEIEEAILAIQKLVGESFKVSKKTKGLCGLNDGKFMVGIIRTQLRERGLL